LILRKQLSAASFARGGESPPKRFINFIFL
jgi:hypothetical protein